ncbi:hypothetical protein Tco_0496938, partial [Tanacetum coccineum]
MPVRSFHIGRFPLVKGTAQNRATGHASSIVVHWSVPFCKGTGRTGLQCRKLPINTGTGFSLKDKNEARPDKTEHGIGKSAKNRGQ